MYQVPNFAGPYSDMRTMSGDSPSAGGGSNQWMDFSSMSAPGFPNLPGMSSPSSTPPGIVPPSGGTGYQPGAFGGSAGSFPFGAFPDTSSYAPGGKKSSLQGGAGSVGANTKLPHGYTSVPTLDPQFTQGFDAWLRKQMGQGMDPFNLSAIMPSTGEATAPGTLTAPLNPVLESLSKFFQGQGGGPMSEVLPMWKSMMDSMNIPIQKQLANIKEQFGSRGALGSSEMASALGDFGSQTAADQESLLGQLTLSALPGMEQFGEGLQGIDQGSIDRLLQEFQRTQPQNNPLLNIEAGLATTFPPIYGNAGFGPAFSGAFGGALGSGLGKGITGSIFGPGPKN